MILSKWRTALSAQQDLTYRMDIEQAVEIREDGELQRIENELESIRSRLITRFPKIRKQRKSAPHLRKRLMKRKKKKKAKAVKAAKGGKK